VFLFCLFSSCSVPCVASFSGLSFFDCPYCISLMFITLPVVYLFVIFCFVHLCFGFLFRLFCFVLFFVLFFILYVLFCFFVCAFKRTLKIHVICRKKYGTYPCVIGCVFLQKCSELITRGSQEPVSFTW
jgi:hypothetical protein